MQKMVNAAEGRKAVQQVQTAVPIRRQVVGCTALGPEAAVWVRNSSQCLTCARCHCIALR